MSDADQPQLAQVAQKAVHPVQGIRAPKPLVLDGVISEAWKTFKQKWHNYAIITNLQVQRTTNRVALFLHTFGDQALKVYNGFTFSTPEEERTVEEIIAKFDAFAVCDVNETY